MRQPNRIYGVFCGSLQPKLFLSLGSARNSCSNSRVYLGEILSTEATGLLKMILQMDFIHGKMIRSSVQGGYAQEQLCY